MARKLTKENERDYLQREGKDKLSTFIASHVGYDGQKGQLFFKAYAKQNARLRITICCNPDEPETFGRCQIAGKMLSAARVAYLIKNGEWPPNEVEFIDNDPLNICWKNIFVRPVVVPEGRMKLEKEEIDDQDETSKAVCENEAFLADLRLYHPRGPLTYRITSRGGAGHYSTWPIATTGSPAGLCASE